MTYDNAISRVNMTGGLRPNSSGIFAQGLSVFTEFLSEHGYSSAAIEYAYDVIVSAFDFISRYTPAQTADMLSSRLKRDKFQIQMFDALRVGSEALRIVFIMGKNGTQICKTMSSTRYGDEYTESYFKSCKDEMVAMSPHRNKGNIGNLSELQYTYEEYVSAYMPAM